MSPQRCTAANESPAKVAEHRDALMGIAWGLSLFSPPFVQRKTELRAGGMASIQARVALARNAFGVVAVQRRDVV
jgi:hypothetical protein